jgi:hypothetical protein
MLEVYGHHEPGLIRNFHGSQCILLCGREHQGLREIDCDTRDLIEDFLGALPALIRIRPNQNLDFAQYFAGIVRRPEIPKIYVLPSGFRELGQCELREIPGIPTSFREARFIVQATRTQIC